MPKPLGHHQRKARNPQAGYRRRFFHAQNQGLHIAKLLGADFVQFPSWRPHQYKCVLNLGFGEDIRFRNAPDDCVKLQYWMPWDIDGLEGIPYKSAIKTIRNSP
jgi:hypothetical protein